MIEAQDFWAGIDHYTETRLRTIIEQGIRDGLGSRAIGKRIKDQMGGRFSRKRAERIARTETGGAMNAGHVVTQETLAAEGESIRKVWLTVGDDDVRLDHEVLDGVEVAPSEDFDVGGFLAPHPSHYSLPVAQRVHCRCTLISVF